MNGIQPLNIFDKYIFVKPTNRSLTDSFYIMTGNKLNDKNVPFKKWMSRFNRSPAMIESKYLYGLATKPETFQFRFPPQFGCMSNRDLYLHTRYTTFLPGSSFTHLDQKKYATDLESFLMRPEADPGKSIDDRGPHVTEDPLGDVTLGVLQLLGYNIKFTPGSSCAR